MRNPKTGPIHALLAGRVVALAAPLPRSRGAWGPSSQRTRKLVKTWLIPVLRTSGASAPDRDAKPQDGPLPCRAFIIFATLGGIGWVLLFWPVRINTIGINPRPSVQNGAVWAGS